MTPHLFIRKNSSSAAENYVAVCNQCAHGPSAADYSFRMRRHNTKLSVRLRSAQHKVLGPPSNPIIGRGRSGAAESSNAAVEARHRPQVGRLGLRRPARPAAKPTCRRIVAWYMDWQDQTSTTLISIGLNVGRHQQPFFELMKRVESILSVVRCTDMSGDTPTAPAQPPTAARGHLERC